MSDMSAVWYTTYTSLVHSCGDVEDEQHLLFNCPADNDNYKVGKSTQVFASRPFLSQKPQTGKWVFVRCIHLKYSTVIVDWNVLHCDNSSLSN